MSFTSSNDYRRQIGHGHRRSSLQTLIDVDEITLNADQQLQRYEITHEQFDDELRRARKLLNTEIRAPGATHKAMLALRFADLLRQDPRKSEHQKIQAAAYAAKQLEFVLQSNERRHFIEPRRIKMIAGLAFLAAETRPDVAWRLVTVIEQLDPTDDIRINMTRHLQPVTVAPYIPPPRPDAISPSAVAPAILKS